MKKTFTVTRGVLTGRPKYICKFTKGFTLAEVLITLTIIGVIAAITIPNLMQKWEEAHTVAGVKEAYSILNNAFKLAIRENGPLSEWQWPADDIGRRANNNYLLTELKKYMKVKDYCLDEYNSKKCAMFNVNGYYKGLNGNTADELLNPNGKAIIVLENSMTIRIKIGNLYSPSEFYNSTIDVDINGFKGPNRYGYDMFFFGLNSNGVFLVDNPRDCNRNSDSAERAWSCARWIIIHGNTDYKNRDISTSADW